MSRVVATGKRDRDAPRGTRQGSIPALPRSMPIGVAITFAAFVGLPVVALAWRAMAVDAFAAIVRTPAITSALLLSFTTSTASLVVSVVVGTPTAFALARIPFRGRRLVDALVEVPVILPPAVAGIALLMAFGRRGLVGSWLESAGMPLAFSTAGVIVAQCFVAMPFYVRTARAAFATGARDLESAALVDGATGWEAFRHVTLPLAMPALAAGAALCWARAMGEFGATLMFAGSLRGRTQTMPLAVYALLETDLDGAVLIGGAFVGLAVAILAVTAHASRHGGDSG